MKKIFDILKIAGLCVGFLLFAACPAAFESDLLGNAQVPEGRGVIQLDVAGPGNRSIFPDEMDNFTWTVTLTADGKDEVTGTLEGGAGKVVVDPATWTVVIEAKFNDEIVGRTTIPDVEVEANEVTRLRDVLIKPVTGVDAAQGRLVYSIQLPEDIIAASIFYSADSDDETEIDLLGLEIVVGADGTKQAWRKSFTFIPDWTVR